MKVTDEIIKHMTRYIPGLFHLLVVVGFFGCLVGWMVAWLVLALFLVVFFHFLLAF